MAFDNAALIASSTAVQTSLSGSFTVGSGSDRAIYIAVYGWIQGGTPASPSAANVTADSVATVALVAAISTPPGDELVSVYRLEGVNSGSITVAVTYPAAVDESILWAISLDGVLQTNSTRAASTSNDTSFDDSPTSAVGDQVVSFAAVYGETLTNQQGTERVNATAANSEGIGISTRDGLAGSTLMDWSASPGSVNGHHIAFAVQAASNPSTVSLCRPVLTVT